MLFLEVSLSLTLANTREMSRSSVVTKKCFIGSVQTNSNFPRMSIRTPSTGMQSDPIAVIKDRLSRDTGKAGTCVAAHSVLLSTQALMSLSRQPLLLHARSATDLGPIRGSMITRVLLRKKNTLRCPTRWMTPVSMLSLSKAGPQALVSYSTLS